MALKMTVTWFGAGADDEIEQEYFGANSVASRDAALAYIARKMVFAKAGDSVNVDFIEVDTTVPDYLKDYASL